MLELKHDGEITIAEGRHRRDTSWRNKAMRWSELVAKLATTHRTAETQAVYAKLQKPEQDRIKDIGGFVGGHLSKGRRKRDNVAFRTLITLDLDFAAAGAWESFVMMHGYAAAMYTTHKHRPDKPRLRIILPLDREIFAEEYEPIARRVAEWVGIEALDHTTYQPERLMYWPSTSSDGVYASDHHDGPWLKADDVLKTYRDWKDSSEWPISSRESEIVVRDIKKQGDPLDKQGIVGAFCRSYTVPEAIAAFLEGAYEPTDIENRYTYKDGSTAGGLVVYEDGKYCYSHHGTDPTSGQLCNAFDLVRIHLFGAEDDRTRPDTPINKKPSYIAMSDLARNDKAVRQLMGDERLAEAMHDFAELEMGEAGADGSGDAEPISTEWAAELEYGKDKKPLSTINNIVLILQHDARLRGRLGFDEFEKREVALRDLPWRKLAGQRYLTDTDDSSTRHWLEKEYDITGVNKITDAVKIVMQRNAFHPVRDYLTAQSWDGTGRIDTLLVDYLGAEDSDYTRAVTRKALVAAVARIFRPGVKFDNMLVLSGAQGQGKSTLIKMLGGRDGSGEWFSDSLGDVARGKDAFEQLQGAWLVEVAELSGLKKADVETVKHFISKTDDRYRVAYGRRVENFARQCVFVGTTNDDEFLRDSTGNRRFWPVRTGQEEAPQSVFSDLGPEVVNQIWAEAVTMYRAGEPLHLSAEMSAEATAIQAEHTVQDDRRGLIVEYLDKMLPEGWEALNLFERRQFLWESDPQFQVSGTVRRDRVTIGELWTEVLRGKPEDMNSFNTKPVHEIMRSIPGWSRGKKMRGHYGIQRGYERTANIVAGA